MPPGLIFLILIGLPLAWAFLRPRRWRGRFAAKDKVIYPSSGVWQMAGVIVAVCTGASAIAYALAPKRTEPQIYLMMGIFFLAGVSVLFRQVELDKEGIAIRELSAKRMRWSELQSANRLNDGSWLLVGGFRSLKLNRHFSDFDLLVLEIGRQLESQHQVTGRLSYEDTCRKLQSEGYLREGDPPVFPERVPQYDDPENYGIGFFRTLLDHNADLSNLSLARCFISRCEVRGALFMNSDLRQSNLCWNDFTHVDFREAVLAGSDMRSSIFVDSRFCRANLRGADLRHSTFERCDFEGAAFQNAILTRTQGASLKLSELQKGQIDWRDEAGPEPPGG